MKGMEKPTDKETAKYNAVAEIAGLLRESTQKRLTILQSESGDFTTETEYYNTVFSESEHETVKRAFLRLVSEL